MSKEGIPYKRIQEGPGKKEINKTTAETEIRISWKAQPPKRVWGP